MPKFIQSARQARQSDHNCIQDGVPSLVLMEKAALQIQKNIIKLLKKGHKTKDASICILCGPGNNGADGLAAARLLKEDGYNPVCIFEDTGHTSEDERVQLKAAQAAQVPIIPCSDEKQVLQAIEKADLLVDALFGSGLSRSIQGMYAALIERVNSQSSPVLAVDIPSGLDGNTGKILGTCVHADTTLALDTIKEGHIRNQGPEVCGRIIECPIGISERYHTSNFYVLDKQFAAEHMAARPDSWHKGKFGKILIAGGSLQMQGALDMAAKAAFHAGCGTVTLYTPKSAAMAIASKNDLAMILPAEEINGFLDVQAVLAAAELVKSYDIYAIGNGMGKGRGAMCLLEAFGKADIPLLIDADGLNCLARQPRLLERTSATIITPHLMEFSRITGKDVAAIGADPIAAARDFAAQYPNITLVLKGDQTVVASGNRMAWIHKPTSALAKGGSGDVLAGLITGLWGWNPDPFIAACLGVYIHNAAAHIGSINPICFTPLDLIANFNTVLSECQPSRSKG